MTDAEEFDALLRGDFDALLGDDLDMVYAGAYGWLAATIEGLNSAEPTAARAQAYVAAVRRLDVLPAERRSRR